MQFTDQHIATFIMASPFLALSAGWLVGLSMLARPARVDAQKEGQRR